MSLTFDLLILTAPGFSRGHFFLQHENNRIDRSSFVAHSLLEHFVTS